MLEIYVFKNIRVAIHTHMKSYTLQIIHVTNHTRMKWWHFIGRSATHPCLTKPSYCMSQCFASRQGLRDFAVKSMRPWRHRTPSLAGRCSVVTQRQSRRSWRWGNLRRRRPAIIDNSRPWGLVLSAILDPDREHFVFEKKYLFHLENSNKTKLMQLKMFETNTSIVNNKKKYMQYIQV